jgi:hypothetical protein
MNAGVFTQNKPVRPRRTTAQPRGPEGQLAPSEEPATCPPPTEIPVPIDIKHASSGKYVAAWRKAFRSKLASLHNKGTFRMESLPLGRNAIGNKWVFKVKAKTYGIVDRLKARLVAQGFSQQRARLDSSETFSSIAKLNTMRTVLAIATTCTRQTSKRVSQRRPPRGNLHALTQRGRGWNASSHAPPQENLWA